MDTNLEVDFAPLARDLNLPLGQVQRALELLDEGNTVPFITRYRKDRTGALDEEQIRRIQLGAARLRSLAERKLTILKSIESQGKLTPELAESIRRADSTKRLEDLYLPFKPKKQNLATQARSRGLEPLALRILGAGDPTVRVSNAGSPAEATTAEGANASVDGADPTSSDPSTPCPDLETLARGFLAPDSGLSAVADVLQGVRHLLAEIFSESADLRDRLRQLLRRHARLVTSRIEMPRIETPRIETPRPAHAPVRSDSPPPAAPQPTEGAPAPEAPSESPEHAGAPIETAATVGSDSTECHAVQSVNGESIEAPLGDASALPAETSEEARAGGVGPDAPAEGAGVASGPAPDGPSRRQGSATAGPPADRKAGNRSERVNRKEKKRQKLEAAFKDYFQFRESLSRIPPHRVLAINRGERARILRVKLEIDADAVVDAARRCAVRNGHPYAEFLDTCLRDALQRLIMPSLEREIRRELTEWAEEHAVDVFVRNLRNLMLQPPVLGRRVLALDPGFRSGCKVIALDPFGNVLGHDMIHVIGRDDRRRDTRQKIATLIRDYRISVVAIGNGTGCREAEQLVADTIAESFGDQDVAYVVVNEAGASVYSTSPIGREELPEYDAVLRGAISIGRRLLDPLSELVKINPANIGVGLYQHDIKAKHLRDSLDAVVESAVNYVGVDVNTASPALLRYVSGLNQLTARRVYEFRCEHGPFRARDDLKKVPGLGDATFVQAAGFLKIHGGDNPLDATWIHPESYDVARRMLEQIGADLDLLRSAVAQLPPERVTASETRSSDAGSVVAGPTDAMPTDAMPTDAMPTDAMPTDAMPTDAVCVVSADGVSADRVNGGPSLSERRSKARRELIDKASHTRIVDLAREWGKSELLLRDILAALTRPGRDPREDLPPPVFRRGIMRLEDLESGMELTGTVLNVVDFGVFVDIGLSDSGLVHISRLADRYVRDPHEVVGVGDTLKVWVIEVDRARRRVSLTAVPPGTERARPDARGRGGRGSGEGGAAQDSGTQASEASPRQEGRPARPPHAAPRDGDSQSGRPPRPAARSHGARPQAGQGGGGSSTGARGSENRSGKQGSRGGPPRSGQPRTWTSRGSAQSKPISKEMEEGTEPMRSFSDLFQFYEKKQPPESPP